MLLGLSIRDFVLIGRLDLAFSDSTGHGGLAALTGETGAGKSILLDAFGLALGCRADSGAVRAGAGQATITAAFSIGKNHAARAILVAQGLDVGDTLILRRVVAADGRGRAFIDDQPVSVALLKRVGETLAEIQGQFEQHGLLSVANHRDALDAFGGLENRATAVSTAWAEWRAAETARAEAVVAYEQARREEEYLRHAVGELDRLAPGADEEDELAARRQLLRHGAAVGKAVVAALAELENGKGLASQLAGAHRLIERQVGNAGGKLDAALAALDRAVSETVEAAAQLEQARDALDADPSALEKVEERLFSLRAAARKHGVPLAGLAGLRERMAEQ